MQPKITYNDALGIYSVGVRGRRHTVLQARLQPTHPLRAFKLFPIAKCWRRYRYLVEEEEPSDLLWVLDLDRKKRIRGKTCYYFKRLETQEELDALLETDYQAWVQYMKDAGAWQGE